MMLVMGEYRISDEPIPNYRLSRFLGRGGFGEVWQAKAPGGIDVAMKFVRLDKKAGKKEFESLRVVKRIKHPHLMAINAFWLKDADGNVLDDESVDLLHQNLLRERAGRDVASKTTFFAESQAAELIIALELCDKNLLDRLRECQSAGLQGIPPDELLDYMDGCAKAIDYLNSPVHVLEDGEKRAVQHCDIKPQNIMLLGGEPKVCDFGLVRAQSDVRKTAIAASLAYASPEVLITGQQSEATDQYSLAVSYYELRTGALPFSEEAASYFAIMKAHQQGRLDFSRLSDHERSVVERATKLNPAARFARTADMVAALRRAYRGEPDSLPAGLHVRKPIRRRLRIVGVAALMLGGVVAGGMLLGRFGVERTLDSALARGDLAAALSTLTKFSRLPLIIDRQMVNRLLTEAAKQATDDWRRSLAVYEHLQRSHPNEPGLDELKVKIIAAGLDEFWGLENKQPQAAEQIRTRLAGGFPADGDVEKLPVYAPGSGTVPNRVAPAADGHWTEQVEYAIDLAEKLLVRKNVDKATEELVGARRMLGDHPGARRDLARRLHLTQASVAVVEGRWSDVEQALTAARGDEIGSTEAPRLPRFHALNALWSARFSGPPLGPAVEAVTDALQSLMRLQTSEQDWRRRQEYEFSAASALVEEIARLAARRALGDDEVDRDQLRGWLGNLDIIGLESLPPSDALAVALAKTLLLVTQSSPPAAEDVEASVGAWSLSVGPDMEDAVARVAHALADWGVASGQLGEAIDHLALLRDASDGRVRNERIRLLDASLQQSAMVDKPDWPVLEKTCTDLIALSRQAGVGVRPFVTVCLAECVAERSMGSNDYLLGIDALAQLQPLTAIAGGEDRAYFAYVSLLARRAAKRLDLEPECMALANDLCQAARLEGVFRSAHRQGRAKEILTAAAEKLLSPEQHSLSDASVDVRVSKDPERAEQVAKANAWLDVARGLSVDKSGNE